MSCESVAFPLIILFSQLKKKEVGSQHYLFPVSSYSEPSSAASSIEMPSKCKSRTSRRGDHSSTRSGTPEDTPPLSQLRNRRARNSSGSREDTPSKRQRQRRRGKEGEDESEKENEGLDLQEVVDQRLGRVGGSKDPAKTRNTK